MQVTPTKDGRFLSELARDIVAQQDWIADSKQLRVETNFAPDEDVWLAAPEALEELIGNVLEIVLNAAGSGTRVFLRTRRAPEEVLFEIGMRGEAAAIEQVRDCISESSLTLRRGKLAAQAGPVSCFRFRLPVVDGMIPAEFRLLS